MTGRPPPAGFAAAPRAPAIVVLAVFAAAGAAVLDDYGVGGDEIDQRAVGLAAANYVLGDGDALRTNVTGYYGVAFEAPLILTERLLGLTDSRAIYLSRHLLTYLFFLTGGWFCYLLAWRLFGNRYLALFALLLFLLHPRIYAHSFVNAKDIPFLVMFMLALYLAQRAFRRGSVAAFALCGVGVGVLINLRVMGLALFAAVPALQALDLVQARGWPERRRLLAAAAVFALAAAGTLYALTPWLWRDPLAFGDALTTLARHPTRPPMLLQGERVRWPFLPAHYLPTWMAITTPPATLLLGLIGAAAVLGRGISRPRRALRHSAERFALLLLACLVLPAAAVAALRANIYNGWRQMYFLYAPLCLLAVYGLHWLLAAANAGANTGAAARRGGRLQRGMICLLAAAALAGMATAGVRLHPYQAAYFNFLVDRRTPERLKTQYDMLYWGTGHLEALEYLLARFSDTTLSVDGSAYVYRNREILTAPARRRLVIAERAGLPADLFINRAFRDGPAFGPVLHARRIYHNTVLEVVAVDLALVDEATAAPYRAAYQATSAGEPLVRAAFDLYLDGRTLTYVKEPCRPEDTVQPFVLRAVPAAGDDQPARLDFRFARYGVRFDGRCLLRRRLPDYPLRGFEIGRLVPDVGEVIEAAVDLGEGGEASVRRHWPENPYWRAHAEITAGERGAPAASAAFDLYLAQDEPGAVLIYHKQPCAAADVRGQARFFVHLFPVDAADLPADHRPHGFHNRSFAWREHGRVLGSACVAIVPLPHYDRGIARIRTGQYVSGQGQLWQAEFPGRAGAVE